MSMYITHTREENGRECFFLSTYQTKEGEEKNIDSHIKVLAMYRIELPLANEQMLNVLKAIDSTTNTCLIEDFLALVFETGYWAGRAAM